jgi:hypothetical protein
MCPVQRRLRDRVVSVGPLLQMCFVLDVSVMQVLYISHQHSIKENLYAVHDTE